MCVCVYNVMKCNNKQNEESEREKKTKIFLKFYQFIEIRIGDCSENSLGVNWSMKSLLLHLLPLLPRIPSIENNWISVVLHVE